MIWTSSQSEEAVAAIDARTNKSSTYGQLRADVAQFAAALPRPDRKSLGLLLARNDYPSLVAYLGALQAENALILLDGSVNPALLSDFTGRYRPDWIFAASTGTQVNEHAEDIGIHPNLALLLSTSGSTGSPKLVRLTLANLMANAESIVQYLGITPSDLSITSLPMGYSYGLSVINSHLRAGAGLVLTDDSVLRREFWEAVDRYHCTSFAGVPYTYQMLLQTGLLNKWGTSLKVFTQAGGRLDDRYVRQMCETAEARNSRFYVMYGQTEATARMSYLPWEDIRRKAGSVGIAIPGGLLAADSETGELVYTGPNVMMGYAECRADLAKGDDLNGTLRTGDLAHQDGDGYFYITGRLKRFLKLFGKRFSLDEAERILSRRLGTDVACYGRDDLLMVAATGTATAEAITATACEAFALPRSAVKVKVISELPRTGNGKLNYHILEETGAEHSLAAACHGETCLPR